MRADERCQSPLVLIEVAATEANESDDARVPGWGGRQHLELTIVGPRMSSGGDTFCSAAYSRSEQSSLS